MSPSRQRSSRRVVVLAAAISPCAAGLVTRFVRCVLGGRRSEQSRCRRGAGWPEQFAEFDTGAPEFQRNWGERPEILAACSQAEARGDMTLLREAWSNHELRAATGRRSCNRALSL